MIHKTKSKTFGIITRSRSDSCIVTFLYRLTSIETVDGVKNTSTKLIWKMANTRLDMAYRDDVIDLLVAAMVTVRYYDYEEKQWMDASTSGGLEPAPGNRDGSWTTPDLETFERDYLYE